MATRTSYLNLIKPDYTDAADIADINANMDTLDTTIQGLDETGSKSLTAHNNATDAHRAMQATVDDTLVPTADLNTIRNLLSNLGNRIKAATGASGWKGNPATTLAAMATLASNLSSGSDVTWSGTKFTNTKLGISGVIDTNGYVSFGPNFGGLIIQWGTIILSSTSGYCNVSLPISVSTILQVYPVIDNNSNFLGNFNGSVTTHSKSTSSFNVGVYQISTSTANIGVDWIAVCK